MHKAGRLIALPAALAASALALAAAPALADAPSFHSATSSIASDGALVATWDERGLGNDNISYKLTANASALWGCINGGNNHPKAANKETINTTVSAQGTFKVKNGRIVASLRTAPPSAGSFSCPNGQTLKLGSVSYTNIVLKDETNNVSVGLPSRSRVLASF